MTQLGRISGQLLDANLVRQGVDLTFRNYNVSDDLLYLDVTNNRVSVNTIGSYDLNVNGTTHSQYILGPTQANIANLSLITNTFSTTFGSINVTPNQSDPLVIMPGMFGGDILFNDNYIKNNAPNGTIVLDPNGSGSVQLDANTTVNGNLTVTGKMQVDGNLSGASQIIVGDSPLDTVVVVPDFTQDILPGDDLTYDLGKPTKRWKEVYSYNNSTIGNLTYSSFTISDQLQVDGPTATITTLQSNDTVLLSSSTGNVDTERIRFNADTILNLDANALSLNSTGIGYVRFIGSNGVVVPAGNDAARPATPEVGDTRWNTENPLNGYLECFDGTVWNTAIGAGGNVTTVEMEDYSNVWILVLG